MADWSLGIGRSTPLFAIPACGMAKHVVTESDHPPWLVDEPSRMGNLKRRCWRAVQLLLLATFLWWIVTPFKWPRLPLRPSGVLPSDRVPDIGLPESFLRTWAQYTPYIPVANYVPPPPLCTISQVSIHTYDLRIG